MPNHICRICDGERPHDGKLCLGCGTELVRCRPTKRKRGTACPCCSHDGQHNFLEQGRRRCVKCGAVFEGPDVGYLDDRPDVNLAKRERLESMKKRRT